MRKSMIATAVVATAGLAASANAGYFQVTNAQAFGGTTNGNIGTGSFELGAVGNSGWVASGVAQSVTPMSGGNLTTLTTIGLVGALANDTLTYFSFHNSGLGYFGVAFKATSSITFDVNFAQLNQASEGVDVTGGSSNGTYSTSGGGTWANSSMTVSNGSTFIAVFGGLTVNNTPAITGVVNFGAAQNISYLSHDGTNWTSLGSGNGTTSNMQFAVYQVPVPAPVLLAGAGLVGAAALRRRMAKKA